MGDPARLVPLWWTVAATALPCTLAVATGLIALTGSGATAATGWVLTVLFGCLGTAALSAFARPRRPLRAATPLVVRAPRATVVPLLVAWAVIPVAALALAPPAPVRGGLILAGALASLPDAVRLVRGRLHWWTLELGEDAITYRGYRTAWSRPWAEVHGARLRHRPAGIVVDVRGGGPDPVLPVTAFAEDPAALAEEIGRRARGSRAR